MARYTTLALCALLFACDRTPQAVRDLPELPAEFARDLAPARTAPVFLSRPKSNATPPPKLSPPPVALEIAKECTTTWQGYVIYPMTVCYPPTPDFGDLVFTQDTGTPPPPPAPKLAPVPPARFYKFASPATKKWMFCSVRGGPWYGRITGKHMCNTNPNIRVFTAEILGAPEPVVVSWTGALDDVPPPLILAAISQAKEECTCCSGVTCPDGTCKLRFDQCGPQPPA